MMNLLILLVFICIGAFAAPPSTTDTNFFKDKTSIENPFQLRDPFKSPSAKSNGKKDQKGYYTSGKGYYSNIQEKSLATVSPQEMKVVGVLIGKERRAMIQSKEGDTEIVVLKEGMKIGPDDAELKAILPGGIVLVEKIINVYGQEEYLETVIPISK